MVQEDRKEDYREYFVDSEESELSDMYEQDSDEDNNERKRMAEDVKKKKTKKRIIPADKIKKVYRTVF